MEKISLKFESQIKSAVQKCYGAVDPRVLFFFFFFEINQYRHLSLTEAPAQARQLLRKVLSYSAFRNQLMVFVSVKQH